MFLVHLVHNGVPASFEVLLHRVQALICANSSGIEVAAPARVEDSDSLAKTDWQHNKAQFRRLLDSYKWCRIWYDR
uniref:Uncharacterized protein n=1 Tax=Lotus japonicus TaxID=34305 RepID=I3SJS6_LOTJA|nr:unknown [Lotus japonicus]